MIKLTVTSIQHKGFVLEQGEDIADCIDHALYDVRLLLEAEDDPEPHQMLHWGDGATSGMICEFQDAGGAIAIDPVWLQQTLDRIDVRNGFPDLDAIAALPMILRFEFHKLRSPHNTPAQVGTVFGVVDDPFRGQIHNYRACCIPAEADGLVIATEKLVQQIKAELLDKMGHELDTIQMLGDRAQQVYDAWLKYAMLVGRVTFNATLLSQLLEWMATEKPYRQDVHCTPEQFTRLLSGAFWLLAVGNLLHLKDDNEMAIAYPDEYPDVDFSDW